MVYENSEIPAKSTLILVPVELTMKSIYSPFGLKRTDEDLIINTSLKQKMKQDFKIEIPDI